MVTSIPSRIFNTFSHIASSTEALEKVAKLIIPSIDLTVITKFISRESIVTTLEVIKRDFKHFTQLMGVVDLINQVALWTIGAFDKEGHQVEKPYLAQIWEKGWNTKLVGKACLLAGKIVDMVNSLSQWKLVDLGALSAATIGRLPYFGQTLHHLAVNTPIPILGLIKDSLMLASTVASAINTLPASIKALGNYSASQRRIEDKIKDWAPKAQYTVEQLRELVKKKAEKHDERVKKMGEEGIKNKERSESEAARWKGYLVDIDNEEYDKIKTVVSYKIQKWTDVHQGNLSKSWWKKQLAAINDIAKVIIILTGLIITVAAFTAPPLLFPILGLIGAALGIAKALYEADSNNQEINKEEFKQKFLAA